MPEFRNFTQPWPRPEARARLVCFHHAGGSAMSFVRLGKALSGEADVLLTELPGHGRRQKEFFPLSIRSFAQECAEELLAWRDPRPLLLYGHSMGGLLAYEVAAELDQAARPPREWLVSACRAPGEQQGPKGLPISSGMNLEDDAQLLELQRAFGSYGPEIGSPLLKGFFLSLLRSDLELIARYRPSDRVPKSPLTALAGSGDPVIAPAEMKGWEAFSGAGFTLKAIPGGHFFPLEDKSGFAELVRLVQERIARC